MTTRYAWQHQGLDAHMAGESRAACPYDVGTAAHLAWIQGWVHGEAVARLLAGTYGATEEQWEQARSGPSHEHGPDPCAEVTANLEEMRREDELAARKAAALKVMDDFTQTVHVVADAAARTFEQIVEGLGPLLALFNGPKKPARPPLPTSGRPVQLGVLRPALDPSPPILPARRCPRHGEELRGGGCRRCQRARR